MREGSFHGKDGIIYPDLKSMQIANKKHDEMDKKPKFVVRKDGNLHIAEFNNDFFKDAIEDGIVYSGPDFRRYLTIGDPVEEALVLTACAELGSRYYQTTEGKLEELKAEYIAKRKNIACIQSGILNQAIRVAHQEEVPYFGIVVVSQQGSFSTEPINADKEPFDDLTSIISEGKEDFLEGKYNFLKEPKQIAWVLHPTVQLYVPKDVPKEKPKPLRYPTR